MGVTRLAYVSWRDRVFRDGARAGLGTIFLSRHHSRRRRSQCLIRRHYRQGYTISLEKSFGAAGRVSEVDFMVKS
jgi:hypothetical protein